jgi:osmoprotectant transport system substrate-binding protein
MDRAKIAGVLTLLLTLSACSGSGTHAISVGSKNFTEQVVLGEIIAQHLEHRLHRPVERRLNLGGTLLAHEALVNGKIDLYPEYTGTALAAVLKLPVESDPSAVLNRVRSEYEKRFHVEWLDPLGVEDDFAMVVKGPDARARNLQTLSDASKLNVGWTLGVGYEFEQRQDGLAALDRTYGLKWNGQPKTMDLGLLYKALEQGQVTMIAANTTDGLLSRLDLKVLTDDRHAFPPYQVAIATREDTMNRNPGLREALVELSGKLTNQQMRELNYRVDGEHRAVAETASEFLKQAGLAN